MTLRTPSLALILLSGGYALLGSLCVAAPWTRAELDETFMRSITRSQCVAKTLDTFKLQCGEDAKCLMTFSDVMGDCLAWAANDVGPMCTYLPSQAGPRCRSHDLNAMHCELLQRVTDSFCDGSISDEPAEVELTAKALFQSVAPSVVVVLGVDALGEVVNQGSGVVIDSEVVASNCHVLHGSQRVAVRYQGRHYRAAIKQADIPRDVCTLAVDTLMAPPVRVDAAVGPTVAIGDKVYAVGAPRGLDLSLSDGLVSGFRKDPQGTYIQTTAAISPGSSGGGLFDAKGRLIGLTTRYLADSQQLNFAVPANWLGELPARSALPDNVKAERRYAREALNRLEASLSKRDPSYRCKKKLVLPAALAQRASTHPLAWSEMFLRLYEDVDPAACKL